MEQEVTPGLRPPAVWSGRSDVSEGPEGRRWHEIVALGGPAQAGEIALLGFASDAGVRRNGGRVTILPYRAGCSPSATIAALVGGSEAGG